MTAIGVSAKECRAAMKTRDRLFEIVELVLDHFIERDYGEEWTATDIAFIQDIRGIYEELDDD